MTESPNLIPHQSDLVPLQLGSNDDVLRLLDSLYQEGGIQAVVKWAEQELQPGRQIIYRGRIGDTVETVTIYDRSVWRFDDQGKMSQEAFLAPLTAEKYGDGEFFGMWARPQAQEPFTLHLRTWVK